MPVAQGLPLRYQFMLEEKILFKLTGLTKERREEVQRLIEKEGTWRTELFANYEQELIQLCGRNYQQFLRNTTAERIRAFIAKLKSRGFTHYE